MLSIKISSPFSLSRPIQHCKSLEPLSKKTKISELYIAQKCVDLANKYFEEDGSNTKKSHVGYLLISDGKSELYSCLLNKKVKIKNDKLAHSIIFYLKEDVHNQIEEYNNTISNIKDEFDSKDDNLKKLINWIKNNEDKYFNKQITNSKTQR